MGQPAEEGGLHPTQTQGNIVLDDRGLQESVMQLRAFGSNLIADFHSISPFLFCYSIRP